LTYLEAVTLVLIAFALPAFVTYIVALRAPLERRRRYHEVGIPVFLQLGVIFAVLLAFVFNDVWSQYDGAADAVYREASDLQAVADRAANLPESSALALRHALFSYLQKEIDDEWPAMERRHTSRPATLAYVHLFEVIAAIPISDHEIANSQEDLLYLLNDVRSQRQLRHFQLEPDIPAFVWALLITFSVVLTIFLVFSGVGHNLVQSGLVGLFSALLVAIMLTIHMLDFPFEGSVRISPAALLVIQNQLNIIPLSEIDAQDR
jgi:hypothetical protein